MENAGKIYKQICSVMQEINAIGKDRRNQTQNFQYRGIDDVMNELHSVLAKCGVFVVPQVLDEARTTGKTKSGGDMFYTRLKIKFTFYAEDGSFIESVVIGEAMDTGDKASNKALSVGLKYALLQVFCIPTEDEKDPDAQSPEPQAGSMKPAPAKKAPAKFAFEPKGGETTPAEKKELGGLLSTKYPNGGAVFSKVEAKKYSDMRKDYTAREVIETIRRDLNARLNPTSQMQTAGDVMRAQAQQAQQLSPQVEAVIEAFDGEVVASPQQPGFDDMQPVGQSEQGFDIY